MEFSYWERTSFLSSWDVIIVGSGIVGLSTSIQLKEKHPNLKILIIEKGHLPQGASTKNAGFACFGSLSELISDLDNSSMDEVLKLVEKRHLGLLSLRKKFGDEGLQYESLGSYEMFKDEEEDSYQKCLEQLLIFNQNLRGIIGPSSFTLSDTNLEVFRIQRCQAFDSQ